MAAQAQTERPARTPTQWQYFREEMLDQTHLGLEQGQIMRYDGNSAGDGPVVERDTSRSTTAPVL